MSEIEKTVRNYLARSAGNANIPSEHTIRCFIGMLQTGEADWELFQRVGGDYLVNRMKTMMEANGWTI